MKKSIVPFLSCLAASACFLLPSQGLARQTVVNGAASLSNSYDSNVFHTDDAHVSEWTTELSPSLSLSSQGQHDVIELSYTPDMTYNHRRDTISATQNLLLNAERQVSDKWRLSFSDSFSHTDNPVFEPNTSLSLEMQYLRADALTQEEIFRLLFPGETWEDAASSYILSMIQINYSDASPETQAEVLALLDPQDSESARQRYWSNEIAIRSDYEFAPDSVFTASYTYDHFDNKYGTTSDRRTHTPSLSLSYRFNPQWIGTAAFTHTNNDYDTSEDNRQNDGSLRLDYQLSPEALLYCSYSRRFTDYTGESSDQDNQNGVVGLTYTLDPRTSLSGSLGADYTDYTDADDERGMDLALSLSRAYKRGSASVNGNIGLTEDSEEGWQKQQRSWSLGSNLSYQWTEKLTSSAYITYQKNHSWSEAGKDSNGDLTTGLSLSHPFMRWFVVSLSYDLQLFDTDTTGVDDYYGQRISLGISVAKDLWRW